MIECGTFPELADKYNVSGVPKIVINETNELVGNQPIDMFLDTIDKL
jgi:protein-disulfide isomerase